MSETDTDGPRYRDEEWLWRRYWEDCRTLAEMGDECGVTGNTIQNWMDKHDIPRRDLSEAQGVPAGSPLRNAEWLREQYCEKQRDAYDIAEELDVGDKAVYNWMDEHGIKRRDQSAAQGVASDNPIRNAEWVRERYEAGCSTSEIAEECGVGVSAAHRWRNRHGVEARDHPEIPPDCPIRDAGWLQEKYCKEWQSPQRIAEGLEVTHRTVWLWLQRHGIETRDSSEYEGDQHWRYGKSKDPLHYRGPNWETKRERARRRDQYRCQHCGMTQSEHESEFGRDLSVHHLTPIRAFCDDDGLDWEAANALYNLLTLCQTCHHSIYEPMAPLRPDIAAPADD